tara:strand:- start:92 stop:937 length:846 start_codon:yes stop_codon:yes gene_type:complete
MKTYIEFGSLKKKRKFIYQRLDGDLYDTYMMSRYFKDLFYLNNFLNNFDLKKLYKSLHHKSDLKLNFINYLLINQNKNKKFYEFGQTLFEKIYYYKIFNKIFKKKNNKTINWEGNDISKIFNFFCRNFYKDFKVKTYDNINFEKIRNSTFFAKGVSLLYEKNNLRLLKYIFRNANCGSFDITLFKKKQNIPLETGYVLHYPSFDSFLKIIPKKNFNIIFRNIKKKKNSIYFEVIFGKERIIKNFIKNFLSYNIKNKFLKKILSSDEKFSDLNYLKKFYRDI